MTTNYFPKSLPAILTRRKMAIVFNWEELRKSDVVVVVNGRITFRESVLLVNRSGRGMETSTYECRTIGAPVLQNKDMFLSAGEITEFVNSCITTNMIARDWAEHYDRIIPCIGNLPISEEDQSDLFTWITFGRWVDDNFTIEVESWEVFTQVLSILGVDPRDAIVKFSGEHNRKGEFDSHLIPIKPYISVRQRVSGALPAGVSNIPGLVVAVTLKI